MIGQSLKNFFKNLKYFFIPLGAIALGFVIGLAIFIPGIKSSITLLTQDLKTIFNDKSIDFIALENNLISSVNSLNWNEAYNAIKTMMSSEWIIETINSSIDAMLINSEIYVTQTNEAISEFSTHIINLVSLLVFFTTLGLIVGFVVTKTLVRKNIAKKSFWRTILVAIVDFLLSATLVSLCVWLITLWQPSIWISAIVSLFLYGFISLFEAYVAHARKKVNYKEVVNAKNIIKLFVADVLIFIIALTLIIIVAKLNAFVGVIVGISLMEIAFIVISLNAEAYVKAVAENKL